MTTEEYDRLPLAVIDRHLRYELISGILDVTPPPDNWVIFPNEKLGYVIRLHEKFHPRGSIADEIPSEQPFCVTPNRLNAVLVISIGRGRLPDVEKDFPSTFVEFAPKRRRHYETRRDEYLDIGEHEYWIIDRFRSIMTVCRNGLEGFASLVIREAKTHGTDLNPEFSPPLGRFLARADD